MKHFLDRAKEWLAGMCHVNKTAGTYIEFRFCGGYIKFSYPPGTASSSIPVLRLYPHHLPLHIQKVSPTV